MLGERGPFGAGDREGGKADRPPFLFPFPPGGAGDSHPEAHRAPARPQTPRRLREQEIFVGIYRHPALHASSPSSQGGTFPESRPGGARRNLSSLGRATEGPVPSLLHKDNPPTHTLIILCVPMLTWPDALGRLYPGSRAAEPEPSPCPMGDKADPPPSSPAPVPRSAVLWGTLCTA